MKTQPQRLLDQGAALGAYLDAMMLPQADADAATVAQAAETDSAPGGQAEPAVLSTGRAPDPSRIQVRLFEVAGLTLGLPAESVRDIVMASTVTVAPARDEDGLILGTHTHGGRQCAVIDTARIVLPAERAAQLAGDPAERSRQLLVIGDGRWSLACNRTGELVEFDRGDVRWRTGHGKRPWLAGLISEKRVALLDVEALEQLLADQMA